MDANGAKSTTPAGQCRLTPLIPLILDCSFLYHFSVRLLFKLHSREWQALVLTLLNYRIRFSCNPIKNLCFTGISPDVLLGHRERFRDLFMSQMGGPEASLDHRETESNGYKSELEALKPEIELIKSEVGGVSSFLEGTQVSSSLAALQAEWDTLLRSTMEKDAELSSLRLQAQQQQSSVDLEKDRLKRELEALRAQLQQQSGTQLNSTLAGLQAEKEMLLKSVRDHEAELKSLRQQAHLHQSTLEQERQRSSMELGSLHAQLQHQVLDHTSHLTVKL
ncbi:hypothetical protein XENOCAPTIV_013831 [Xenoophorus captivus]|uniref:AP180 N-terminal homology (ANTH) domain-containing protein n=1 Tax=Xenoophorus captivus TaxID=1517983 RepID=A0ABV0QVJ3_9TELE